MTMTYDGTMVLPSNYVVVDQNEMEYVEGGITKEKCWWGIAIGLNSTESNAFAIGSSVYNYALGAALGIAASIAGVLIGAIATARGCLLTYFNNDNSGVWINFNWAQIAQMVACPATAIPMIALCVPITDRG